MPRLRKLRESLGFTADEVAHAGGWSRARMAELEKSDDPDEAEADRLTDLYGVDVEDVLLDHAEPAASIATLLRSHAEVLDAESRFVIAESASVARQVRELQALLGMDDGWAAIQRFRPNADYGHPRHGGPERLGALVRKQLGVDDGPIASVHDVLLRPLGIVVLWTTLPQYIDAFSMSTAETGGVIVCNAVGHHMATAFGRRITFAHELCHILFDRNAMNRLNRFCVIARPARRGRFYEIERRARAFAAQLLVPTAALRDCWEQAADGRTQRVRCVMERFGIGYEATRAVLSNAELLHIVAKMSQVPTEVPDHWERADPPPSWNALARRAGASLLRAGLLTDLAFGAWREGLVAESLVQELLRLERPAWEGLREAVQEDPGAKTWQTSSAWSQGGL